ncbi:MAG: hypothetical protein AAF974_00050 [Cyanobacteria bacterium P01_E01_bin.34]
MTAKTNGRAITVRTTNSPAPPAAKLMLLSALVAVALLLQLLQALFTYQLFKKPAPTLVQLADGTSMAVGAIGGRERTPAAVQNFVYRALSGLFSASGSVPNGRGGEAPDRQFEIDGSPVATSAWAASHALAAEFTRPELLAAIAEMTPPQVFDPPAQMEVRLEISHLSEPAVLGEGRWRVDVVATRVVTERGIETHREAFNKSVWVRAVEPYRHVGVPTVTGLALEGYRGGGMEIYAIDALRLEDPQ